MHSKLTVATLITVAAAASPARAGSSIEIASCGDSKLAVLPGTGGASGQLEATIATAGSKWTFTARVGQVRIGGKARTLSVEDPKTGERIPPRAKDSAPSGMSIDLLLDSNKVLLRHASEGGDDPEYAVDLAKCTFAHDGDLALAGFVPKPREPIGCDAATVKATYRPQVSQVAKLADADADKAALALCTDHQKTLDARGKLEQAITDRAAHDRISARGAALLHVEDVHEKAWARIDTCLGIDPSKAQGVAALHDGEAKQRACYGQIAAKP